MTENSIKIKSKEEIECLQRAGKILSVIVQELKSSLRAGITTKDIDRRVEELIRRYKVQSAFKGYRGFPNCSCVSVNEEVVHGIPGNKIIKEGDIVSVDVGIVFENYFSDTAFTVGIGRIDSVLERLLDVTEKALYKGIEQALVDRHLSDISFAIQKFVEAHQLSVVRDFVGHGIGLALHEEPEVPNFGSPHCGPILKEGMVLAIEPMVNIGTFRTRICEDGWTVVTEDRKPSAHFEHTIVITKSHPEILTK